MALINKVNFTRFTRWGVNLGRLTYTTATHEEATDGTDELKITCDEDLTKGERLVWLDRQALRMSISLTKSSACTMIPASRIQA